jgi:hypothetical protein
VIPHLGGSGAVEEEVPPSLLQGASSAHGAWHAALEEEVAPRTEHVDVGEVREDPGLGGQPEPP